MLKFIVLGFLCAHLSAKVYKTDKDESKCSSSGENERITLVYQDKTRNLRKDQLLSQFNNHPKYRT